MGNGSSISAINKGECVDTSMGFTPLDGLLMGTRCGSVDPSVVTYIMDKKGFTPAQMSDYMNKKSGLLGVHAKLTKISAPDSKVEVWVVPTNEELLIARDTMAVVG